MVMRVISKLGCVPLFIRIAMIVAMLGPNSSLDHDIKYVSPLRELFVRVL